jgi:hypothetical protein
MLESTSKMPGKTTERTSEPRVGQIPQARGIWKAGRGAAVERLQEYRTALTSAAVTGWAR